MPNPTTQEALRAQAMELPKLPDPEEPGNPDAMFADWRDLYTEKQMREYGRACAEAALRVVQVEKTEDAQMMDWMERAPDLSVLPATPEDLLWEVRGTKGNTAFGKTLREAIRAAMSKESAAASVPAPMRGTSAEHKGKE